MGLRDAPRRAARAGLAGLSVRLALSLGATLIYRRHWREYGAAIRFAAILGLAFGAAAGATVIKPPLTGALFVAVSATTDMAVGMAMIGAIELLLPRMPAARRLFALPFLVVVLAKALVYLAGSVRASRCSRRARKLRSCSRRRSKRAFRAAC